MIDIPRPTSRTPARTTQRRSRRVNGSVVALAVVAVGSVAALAGSVELAGVDVEGVVDVLVGETPPLGVASVFVAGVVFAVVVTVVVVVVVAFGCGAWWLPPRGRWPPVRAASARSVARAARAAPLGADARVHVRSVLQVGPVASGRPSRRVAYRCLPRPVVAWASTERPLISI